MKTETVRNKTAPTRETNNSWEGQVWSFCDTMSSNGTHKYENISVTEVGQEYGRYDQTESHRDPHSKIICQAEQKSLPFISIV